MNTLTIHVNGHPQIILSTSLPDLLKNLNVSSTYMAVAINNEVIPSADYAKVVLKHGDCLEIIQPVSGG